jgi:hypothetical protein
MGKFFNEKDSVTNHNSVLTLRRHRTPIMTDSTFCGRLNMLLSYLKSHYPTKQIIVFTPIHRGPAVFHEKNVQPDETFSNGCGLFFEDYVDAIKRAGTLWAVPVIDLHALSGLYPMDDAFVPYFHDGKTDRLHPNALGHYRLARTMQYQLLALPSSF